MASSAERAASPASGLTSDAEPSAPKRVKLSRAKGWRMPPNTVKVDRSTRFGNPYKVDATPMRNGGWMVFLCTDGHLAGPPVGFFPTKREATAGAVELFRARLNSEHGELLRRRAFAELRGQDLACWCKLGAPCHADVWLEVANAPAKDGTSGANDPLREASNPPDRTEGEG